MRVQSSANQALSIILANKSDPANKTSEVEKYAPLKHAIAVVVALIALSPAAAAEPPYLPLGPPDKPSSPYLQTSRVSIAIANNYYRTTDAKMILAMNESMETVRERIKGPKAVEFRDVYFHNGAGRLSVTCGSVKVMGNYQYFVSTGALDMTYLERDAEDFSDLWATLCQGTVPSPNVPENSGC